MIYVSTSETNYFSRFAIGDAVVLNIQMVKLQARIFAVNFMEGKVLYDLQVYTGQTLDDLKGEYGIKNSLGWDEDGREYVRVFNVDSVFVEPPVANVMAAEGSSRIFVSKRRSQSRVDKPVVHIELDIPEGSDAATTVPKMLVLLKYLGDVGASRSVTFHEAVGGETDWRAGFDGDGADSIRDLKINGKKPKYEDYFPKEA